MLHRRGPHRPPHLHGHVEPVDLEGTGLRALLTPTSRSFSRARASPQFISSGSGAAEVWAGFADGRITSATADVALLDIHTQLADNLEPLKLAWLESRLYYNGSFGDRAEQTFGVRKLDFMTADRRRLKPTDASVTIRTDSAGQISDGAITVSRLDIGSLIALVPELPLDDAVRSFVTAHAPEGLPEGRQRRLLGQSLRPGNWRPAATFKDLSLKAADGIPGIRAISGSISPPSKNGEGFKVVLDSPKSTLSFPGIFRHSDMKFDTLKATAEIVPHPTLTVRLPSFEASNPDAALKEAAAGRRQAAPARLSSTARSAGPGRRPCPTTFRSSWATTCSTG